MYCASWHFQKVPVQGRVPASLSPVAFRLAPRAEAEVAPELLTVQKGPWGAQIARQLAPGSLCTVYRFHFI